MRHLRMLLICSAVLMHSLPAFTQNCLPTECCIEKDCCWAEKISCGIENCICSFECSASRSFCQCNCASKMNWGRVTPNIGIATGLSASAGWEVGSEAGINLEQMAILIQNGYNWYVNVDSDVEDTEVGDGTWGSTFQNALTSMASDLGVEVDIDSENTTITFSSAE